MNNLFGGLSAFADDKQPDRPLECSECKKPIALYYTEMLGSTAIRTSHCADCPVLQRKLYGDRLTEKSDEAGLEANTELLCGHCGTTLEAVRMGSSLGCSICYDVFEEVLLAELMSMGKIPPRLMTAKKSQLLHQGRMRGESVGISASMRLLALNEALNEMLQREDYEQAARLRDQIKALTDEQQATEDKNEDTNGSK